MLKRIVLFTILLETCASTDDGVKFPANFVFGTAVSAFQVEGAWDIDGRQPSIWDTFANTPGNIHNNDNATTACDFYNKFGDDIELMNALGLRAFRFSISWSRVISYPSGQVNDKGIAFYNSVITKLLENDIVPYVTLFHWDLPQALENEQGWLNASTIDRYVEFATVCFDNFGDRVKNWFTFNEPRTFALRGYQSGDFAPGRCSNCSSGNSATEPYTVAHNILLAHSRVVDLYRKQHARPGINGGQIGIVLDSEWYVAPKNENLTGAERALEFSIGWFADPIWTGDYPASMRQHLGSLPSFTANESALLKGSADFFALNHYTSMFVKLVQCPALPTENHWEDACVERSYLDSDGTPIGETTPSPWLYVYPQGMYNILKYIHGRYNTDIYVTENGRPDDTSSNYVTKDQDRQNYYRDYLYQLTKATYEGVKVKGFFAWSLLDNFEWTDGYSRGFGLIAVDFKTLERYPKEGAAWLQKYIDEHMAAETTSYPYEVIVSIGVIGFVGAVLIMMLARWRASSAGAAAQPLLGGQAPSNRRSVNV